MEIVSSLRQTENKRPVDRCTDVLRSEDRVKTCGRCQSPPRRPPPAAAGEQVDRDLGQKALQSRREPAAETMTASSKQDLTAVGDTCTNGVVGREEARPLHTAGALCLCRLTLTRGTRGIPEWRRPHIASSSLSLRWLVNGS